jgi:CRISPR-associated endonuclease/helicase Cas3
VDTLDFEKAFCSLTGYSPFPWQKALYENWFSQGKIPASCNLPTGLGKTSVIAVWLIALMNKHIVPRRLVYVVNRRTVVDQTTDEVERYRKNLAAAGITEHLAISTLRGQFADNREWSEDPSRAAVICGTVDMIGSRLLFSGYGTGFKTRPLHAGFLGQDALLIHDEAHLEPAFQKLLIAIEEEQKREASPLGEQMRLRVMELTATSRADGQASFELTEQDREHAIVRRRINAVKRIFLHENRDEKKLAEEIAELALKYKDSGRAILVFVRKVDDVEKIVTKLTKEKQKVQQLTGTLRGLERDQLPHEKVFARFLPISNRPQDVTPWKGTVYLVCSSAGEVGVNISADHLICDLSTFESMAQRFGRVNRFGDCDVTAIHVIHPKAFETKNAPYEFARERTFHLLTQLPQHDDKSYDGSPAALGRLDAKARQEAFAPTPTILPVSDILFDSWSLTTISPPLVRNKLPGRPPVEPYLHGSAEWQPPETKVAWREEVQRITGDELMAEYEPAALLADYPLKPHELLSDNTARVFDRLKKLVTVHRLETVLRFPGGSVIFIVWPPRPITLCPSVPFAGT